MSIKKIFEIGTTQYFIYKTPFFLFFNEKAKNRIMEKEHWVIRNVKYIYANTEEEAKEKYRKWFFKEYKKITRECLDWFLWSDGVDIMMNESLIDITFTDIVSIDNEYLNVNYEKLKDNMQAENFKEWWFDNRVSS